MLQHTRFSVKLKYPDFVIGMDWIAVLPDIRPTGYPAILKTGYQISGGCRIPDIRPDILLDTGYFRHMINGTTIFLKILHHFIKTRASKLIKSEKRVNIFFIRFDRRGQKYESGVLWFPGYT